MTPGSGSWSRISFGSGAGAPTRTHGAVVAGEHAVVTTRPCSALSARPRGCGYRLQQVVVAGPRPGRRRRRRSPRGRRRPRQGGPRSQRVRCAGASQSTADERHELPPPPAWRMLNASMIWEKPRNNAESRCRGSGARSRVAPFLATLRQGLPRGRARDRCKLMEVRQGLSRTSSCQSAKSSRLEAGCARHFPGNGRLGRGSSPSQSPRQRGVRPASAAFLCGIRRNRTGDLLLAIDGGWLTTLSSTACRHSTDLLRGTTER